MNIKLSNIGQNLYLLDLDQEKFPGFRQFISTWIYHSPGLSFVVDPGPENTIHVLIKTLKDLEIDKLDYILLTHIHLDHAGGSGHLLREYPQTKVICHPKAVPHLLNPDRLNAGSIKVLGNLAETFQPMSAIPVDLLDSPESLSTNEGEIVIIDTPGHAVHHQSFYFRNMLFCGEALGTSMDIPNGFYQRLATPPPFKYEIFKNSINRIAKLKPKSLCFAHYGFREDSDRLIFSAGEQLDFWMDFIEKKSDDYNGNYERLFTALLEADPLLKDFNKLPDDIQKRERYFAQNSMKGIHQYLISSN